MVLFSQTLEKFMKSNFPTLPLKLFSRKKILELCCATFLENWNLFHGKIREIMFMQQLFLKLISWKNWMKNCFCVNQLTHFLFFLWWFQMTFWKLRTLKLTHCKMQKHITPKNMNWCKILTFPYYEGVPFSS